MLEAFSIPVIVNMHGIPHDENEPGMIMLPASPPSEANPVQHPPPTAGIETNPAGDTAKELPHGAPDEPPLPVELEPPEPVLPPLEPVLPPLLLLLPPEPVLPPLPPEPVLPPLEPPEPVVPPLETFEPPEPVLPPLFWLPPEPVLPPELLLPPLPEPLPPWPVSPETVSPLAQE
jgi:homeobox protein ESX1